MMLNCRDTTFPMSLRRERDPSLSERMKLRLHAGMCRDCANFERQVPFLGEGAKSSRRMRMIMARKHLSRPATNLASGLSPEGRS